MARTRRDGTAAAGSTAPAGPVPGTTYTTDRGGVITKGTGTGGLYDQYGNEKSSTAWAPGTTYDPSTGVTNEGTRHAGLQTGKTGAAGPDAGTWQGIATPLPDFAAQAAAGAEAAAKARAAAGQAPSGTPAPNPHGTESGNTYLEDRYLQRLYGKDPAFNYAAKRGMESLGTRSAAAGNFNSGAARAQESDFMANILAQSQGQLDALAGGATGARQNKLNAMFNQGIGLAGGQSGTNTAYDLKTAEGMQNALNALLGYTTGKGGVDPQSNQQGINNLIAAYTAL